MKKCSECNKWERIAKALQLRLKVKQDEIDHLNYVLEKVSKKYMLMTWTPSYFETKKEGKE